MKEKHVQDETVSQSKANYAITDLTQNIYIHIMTELPVKTESVGVYLRITHLRCVQLNT